MKLKNAAIFKAGNRPAPCEFQPKSLMATRRGEQSDPNENYEARAASIKARIKP